MGDKVAASLWLRKEYSGTNGKIGGFPGGIKTGRRRIPWLTLRAGALGLYPYHLWHGMSCSLVFSNPRHVNGLQFQKLHYHPAEAYRCTEVAHTRNHYQSHWHSINVLWSLSHLKYILFQRAACKGNHGVRGGVRKVHCNMEGGGGFHYRRIKESFRNKAKFSIQKTDREREPKPDFALASL